ncbi:hypothetical protein PsAD2_02755 [Pseudovibrio axinellae]|uniref:Glutamine amidotransferase domain-containing protein n=1 Tax=Pseudovibrio axinellae TaxID=989403 RepID=A0A165XTG2_9HYPH|nr:hypothetical protein [Pseudovibrio axinellae]KZL18021.1 hypothetical protein PsAD2_02755 [Pseudovibrio axinellae]SER13228.1 hypothetical protein SAMN05421798_106225 [Pseudovibrio axinellae]
MTWSLSIDPLMPLSAIIALGMVIALVCAYLLFLGSRGALMRTLCLALLALALLNPAILREDREFLPSTVVVVSDNSQSQQLENRSQQTAEVTQNIVSQLQAIEGIDLRQISLNDTSMETRDGTRAFTAISNELADVPPERIAGAILITDGQIHDVPSTAENLGFSAPIHALVTGREGEFDRRLKVAKAPRFGLVGSTQIVQLEMIEEGTPQPFGSRAEVTVRRNGDILSKQFITSGYAAEITVEIEHGGENIYEFEVESLDGELTQLNNRSLVTIDGIRENLRVLLVSGSPHAGERTWRNLLKSDASVDLVHFTILRPPEKQDGTPINQLSLIAFPTRELFSVKIDEFDLIIFDRYERRGVLPLLYFDNIARYVSNGGAVLIAGGPDYAEENSIFRTPLGRVLPATPTGEIFEQPFHASVSELGLRHPVTRNLPGAGEIPPQWGKWFRLVGADVQEGQPVMTALDNKPLLVLSRVGKGRVAALLSDHVWLWARGYEGGGPHVPLLRRLAHWLMKEPDLEEEALRLSLTGSTLTTERQTLANLVDPVTLTTPSGKTEQVKLTKNTSGHWTASIKAEELGLYSATDGAHTALINVGPPNPREFLEVVSTTKTLASITTQSKGIAERVAANGSTSLSVPNIIAQRASSQYHGNGWIGIKRTDASILNGIDRYPLLIGFLGLALLLGLLSFTWYREGR